MIVCIFEHVQWRWALNDRLALGQACERLCALPEAEAALAVLVGQYPIATPQ
jgi:hypothetical protein